MSEHWSCYGETTIQTPNIDKLAHEGELFENAFITAPVCSPARIGHSHGYGIWCDLKLSITQLALGSPIVFPDDCTRVVYRF